MISQVLSQEQLGTLHAASLRILTETGVQIPHEDMLSRLAGAGAKVDLKTHTAKIPEALVTSSLASAGKKYTLYGRDPERQARFGQGEQNFNAIAGEASWIAKPGDQRRFTTLEDTATASRCCDALENINIAGAMSDPHDLPTAWRCVEVFATMLRNTTKPVTFWFHDRASARFINEIMIAVRGSEEKAAAQPICYPFLEPISPLRFPHDGIDLLYETARLNLPVPIGPMAQMGLSAPMSIAGTMTQQNAEILAGVCITQLVREGMPVCYGGICHAFDMGTTQMIFSGPEQCIFGVGMTQLGKSYGLPVYINVGLTDSKRPDAQAGLEAGVSLTAGMAAGADIFGHMGISGVDQASSLDMLVLQNEVISYAKSVNRPIEITDEALGLDIIAEVGHGGTFVDQMHTAERFRQELWFPQLLDRNYYQAWLDEGARSTEDRCRERKEEILATHQPEPISADLDQIITEIVDGARKELEISGADK